MKKILKLLMLVIILIFQSSAFAEQEPARQIKQVNVSISEKELEAIQEAYKLVPQDEWHKYFKNNSRQIRKKWKLQKNNLTKEYNNSYLKVIVYVDKDGNISSYKLNGSCVPSGDTKFVECAIETLKSIKKFDKLPDGYMADFIAFTVKFNSIMSVSALKTTYWERYGVACIEVAKNKTRYQNQ